MTGALPDWIRAANYGGLKRGFTVFVPVYDLNGLRSIRFQYVTVGLIAINVAVFVLFQLGYLIAQDVCGAQSFAKAFGVVPLELQGLEAPLSFCPDGAPQAYAVPESLTLFTYMFLHGDLLHLGGNMLFLWVFGDNVEDAIGHVGFLVFYLACGALAGLAHFYMLPGSALPLVGASGAVSGCVAAYLMLHPRVQLWVLIFRVIPIKISAGLALGAWIAMQLGYAVLSMQDPTSPVAWWAHVGGLAAGAILIVLMRRPGVPLFDGGLTKV